MKPAVVLFSGGVDSSTCLAVAREEGFAPHALAVRYGQRHEFELSAAERVASALEVPLRVVSVDLRAIGGSALTADIDVPKDQPIGTGPIPVTYVPARNTVFLALALGYAEVLGADPFSGAVLVFRSRRADRIKILLWDGSGLVLVWKQLEASTFRWPAIVDGVVRLTPLEFSALFDGIGARRTGSNLELVLR